MGMKRREPSDEEPADTLPVEDLYELTGTPLPEDQDVIMTLDEIETEPEYTDTERYELLPEPVNNPDDTVDVLVAREGRSGETDDPNVAASEGLAYIPPTDPPPLPGESPLFRGETQADLSARVREAFRADGATTQYADEIEIRSAGGVVVLRGVVDDIDDTDVLAEVASAVAGVIEVRDELTVAGL
jgi:hypothetical protein